MRRASARAMMTLVLSRRSLPLVRSFSSALVHGDYRGNSGNVSFRGSCSTATCTSRLMIPRQSRASYLSSLSENLRPKPDTWTWSGNSRAATCASSPKVCTALSGRKDSISGSGGSSRRISDNIRPGEKSEPDVGRDPARTNSANDKRSPGRSPTTEGQGGLRTRTRASILRSNVAGNSTSQIGGRGMGRTVPDAGVGRGGRGGSARGLHDGGPYRPERLEAIPEDQLQISFTRSSGAGGQNVNKVSTKVEVRFVVEDAEWLPHDVRLRLSRQESGRINNRGELVITAQEFRTQKQNRAQALQKLRDMVNEAWHPAKERKMRTGISRAAKETRKADKRHRSQVKSGRSKLSSRDYD